MFHKTLLYPCKPVAGIGMGIPCLGFKKVYPRLYPYLAGRSRFLAGLGLSTLKNTQGLPVQFTIQGKSRASRCKTINFTALHPYYKLKYIKMVWGGAKEQAEEI
jgi:hypothetical protein